MSLMMRKEDGSEEKLEDYYNANPPVKHPCNNSKKTKWWCIMSYTPYNCHETLNYFLKMLVLPGIIAFCIVLLIIFTTGDVDNFILLTIITSLTYTASIFISFYIRDRILTSRHKIQEEVDKVERITPEENNATVFHYELELNPIKETIYKIGFVGDIMMMKKFGLRFENQVKEFFEEDSGVNIIVGNLEGIVREPPKDPFLTKQVHPMKILKQLNQLLEGNDIRWLLCLSNNHSIDYGNRKFHESLNLIQEDPKIDVFGRNDVPNVFVERKNINIASASEWSNQKTWKCISKYRTKKLNPYHDDGKFNILYPHWNFENERYVRRRLQKRAKKLMIGDNDIKSWDLIFGHHPHVRQPVIKVRADYKKGGVLIKLWKLVAFSGGNFTSGAKLIRRKKHIHGRIMRCDIGPLKDDQDRLAVGKVKIMDTVNKEGHEIDRNGDKIEFKNVIFGLGERGIHRFWVLLIGLAIVVIVVLLRIFGIF
ncbi:MAG: CapA family protein [Promethearchaeota archaeon]